MPDETTGPPGQTSPKGGQPSGDEGGTTSDDAKTVTLTQEELRKRTSDAAAKAGREAKAESVRLTAKLTETQTALDQQKQDTDAVNDRLAALDRQMRESKLDRNDPKAVAVFEERETVITEKAALERDNRGLRAEQARIAEERKGLRVERISIIAERYGADVDDLTGLGDVPYEAVERYAKAIGKPKPPSGGKGGSGKGEEGSEQEGDDFTPDSSLGGGAGGGLDLDEDEQQTISAGDLAKRMKAKNPDLLT